MENSTYNKDQEIFSPGSMEQNAPGSVTNGEDGSFRLTPNMNTNMNTNVQPEDDGIIPVKNWILICILNVIPIVNIVALVMYLAKSDIKPDQKNWAKAQLVMIVIAVVLVIVLSIAGAASLFWALS